MLRRGIRDADEALTDNGYVEVHGVASLSAGVTPNVLSEILGAASRARERHARRRAESVHLGERALYFGGESVDAIHHEHVTLPEVGPHLHVRDEAFVATTVREPEGIAFAAHGDA